MNSCRIRLFLIIVVLFGLYNFDIVYAESGKVSTELNSSFEEILSVEAGRGDSQVDYYLGKGENGFSVKTGVESFTVDDCQRVYLSNFADGKIKVFYQNKLEDNIDISHLSQPRDVKVDSGFLYVLEDKGQVTEIFLGNEDNIINKHTVSRFLNNKKSANKEKSEGVKNKPVSNVSMPLKLVSNFSYDYISTLYSNHSLVSFKNETGFLAKHKFPVENFELPIQQGKFYKQLIGIDGRGLIYILGTEVINKDDRIEINENVFKFSSTGKLLGAAETVNKKNFITPFKYLDLNTSGDVFQLSVLEDRVKVFKLNFKEIEELQTAVSNKTASSTVLAASGTEGIISPMGKNAVDDNNKLRQSLYNKAVELINLKWTYNPEVNAEDSNNIVMPYYLKKLEEKRELTGIPYCWGGFDSTSTKSKNQDWSNFLDAVSRGNTAGNVGVTSHYIPETAGLDCSGLASAVLGLDSRQPSWFFQYDNNLVEKINYERLKLMDILVKNGHILFYVDKNNYGVTSIETNVLGSEWKVKYFNWSWRALRDMGYMARGIKL